MTAFSRYLTALIEQSGKTVVQIAMETGIAERKLRYWKNGHHDPETAVLPQLMKALKGDVVHALNLIGGAEIERAGEEDAHLFMANRPPQRGGRRRS
ncbi:MAG TPA: hypothetical protein VFT66_15765 [Roseiflexaceae bacterium]|nr:hypothetical protein [Roseiflexaceae bacterium]